MVSISFTAILAGRCGDQTNLKQLTLSANTPSLSDSMVSSFGSSFLFRILACIERSGFVLVQFRVQLCFGEKLLLAQLLTA